MNISPINSRRRFGSSDDESDFDYDCSSNEEEEIYFRTSIETKPSTTDPSASDWNPEDNVTNLYEAIVANVLTKEFVDQNHESINKPLNETGMSPMLLAASLGHAEALELLFEGGAFFAANAEGFTPLMGICSALPAKNVDRDVFEENLCKCVEVILKSCEKVDVNAKDCRRTTALMLASYRGYALLVEKLVLEGADLNAKDSQRWTALLHAVDGNQGHVVRKLLTAGADANVITLDGMIAIDYAKSRNPPLCDLLAKFSEKLDIDFENPETVQLDESENIIAGMGAMEYIPKLRERKISLDLLLQMNNTDLIEIGIDKVEVRRKILECSAEIHNTKWSKYSLPKLRYTDKQKGIYMDCSDALLQLENICEHVKYLSANVKFISNQMKQTPEILILEKDSVSVEQILEKAKMTQHNLVSLNENINHLMKILRQSRSALGSHLLPAFQIMQSPARNKKLSLGIATVALFLLIGINARKVCWSFSFSS